MKKTLVCTTIGLCLLSICTFSAFARQEAEKEYQEWKNGTAILRNNLRFAG